MQILQKAHIPIKLLYQIVKNDIFLHVCKTMSGYKNYGILSSCITYLLQLIVWETCLDGNGFDWHTTYENLIVVSPAKWHKQDLSSKSSYISLFVYKNGSSNEIPNKQHYTKNHKVLNRHIKNTALWPNVCMGI